MAESSTNFNGTHVNFHPS
jgi:hypothetical protein